MTTDMTAVIQPRSDQINADSLIGGSLTIRITTVDIKPGAEQPITVHYENENGKPWRPCKGMARAMVAAWGPDASQYKGRSLTLYTDPTVTWGGMAVGGLRISHMSHIERDMVFMNTVSRGKKNAVKIKPLKADVAPLKAVETETAFDWQAFETAVDDALANDAWGPQEIAEWWEGQKPNRLQARDADKARAAVVATRVAEHLKQGDY
jgi:hypothetical protein